jgi:hypothetical protein
MWTALCSLTHTLLLILLGYWTCPDLPHYTPDAATDSPQEQMHDWDIPHSDLVYLQNTTQVCRPACRYPHEPACSCGTAPFIMMAVVLPVVTGLLGSVVYYRCTSLSHHVASTGPLSSSKETSRYVHPNQANGQCRSKRLKGSELLKICIWKDTVNVMATP